MTYKRGSTASKGWKGVSVHAAGPIGNYAAILMCSFALSHGIGKLGFLRGMIVSNTAMLLINLLPALPLDGGQILFCLGYYLFPVSRLITSLSFMGVLLGMAGVGLLIYGFITQGLLNCSLLLISIHLISNSGKYRHILMAENIYTVMHEKMIEPETIRKMIYYQVPPDRILIELVPYLKQNLSTCFVFSEEGCKHELCDDALWLAMLSVPYATISQAYQSIMQHQEKVPKNLENARFTP